MMGSKFHCTKSTVQPTDGKQIWHMMFWDLMLYKIWDFQSGVADDSKSSRVWHCDPGLMIYQYL
jgi:hypothetical protein